MRHPELEFMVEEEEAEPTTAAGFPEVAEVHEQQEEQSESEGGVVRSRSACCSTGRCAG